jgi:hypothetical protein
MDLALGSAAVALLQRGSLVLFLRMILSENRFPLFGIMR